jgi:hypothetical protein
MRHCPLGEKGQRRLSSSNLTGKLVPLSNALNLPRTPRREITTLVQWAGVNPIGISVLAIRGTRSMLEMVTVLGYLHIGRSCWTGDPCCGMRAVRVWAE